MGKDKKADERIAEMHSIMPRSWDTGPIVLAHEIREFLKAVRDEGTSLDSGSGDGSADLWVTVSGVEYFINIRRSNGQLTKDGDTVKGRLT